MNKTNKIPKILLIIVAICIIAKIGFALHHFAFIQKTQNICDQGVYNRIAVSILNGKGFSIDGAKTAMVPPLYPLFLSIVYKFFGVHVFSWLFIQILLNAMLSIIIFLITEKMFDRIVALWASIFTCINLEISTISAFAFSETLFLLLLYLGVYLLIISLNKKEHLWALLFSMIFFGLAILTRSVLLGFPALLAVYFTLFKKEWAKASIIIIITITVLIPWAARNYMVFHRIIPINSEFGYILFYEGNKNMAEQWNKDHPKELIEIKQNYDEWDKKDRQYVNQALRVIYAYPLQFALNTLRRFMSIFSLYANDFSFAHKLIDISYYIIMFPSAFCGILLSFMKKRGGQIAPILYLLILYFIVFHSIVYFDAHFRYRMPIEPIFGIYSAYAFVKLSGKIYGHRD